MNYRGGRIAKIAVLGLVSTAALVARSGVVSGAAAEPATVPAVAEEIQGKILDPSNVCFINNRNMEKPQIPVTVDGKTYYGCCAGCAKALQTDRSTRFARDPLTGREVDKATATIIEDPRGSGTVLYFESVETMERHLAAGL